MGAAEDDVGIGQTELLGQHTLHFANAGSGEPAVVAVEDQHGLAVGAGDSQGVAVEGIHVAGGDALTLAAVNGHGHVVFGSDVHLGKSDHQGALLGGFIVCSLTAATAGDQRKQQAEGQKEGKDLFHMHTVIKVICFIIQIFCPNCKG